ncbi:MAG: hypothetical protein SCI25_01605 [Desulfuromonadales bacterium]|nr:hypothetical protein [Desulfuromonadales bacterium]
MFEFLMLIGFFSAILSSLTRHAPKKDFFSPKSGHQKRQRAHPPKRAKMTSPGNARNMVRPA